MSAPWHHVRVLFPCSLRIPTSRWAVDAWTGPGWKQLSRHQTLAAAPPQIALAALTGLRVRELPAVRALFALRRLKYTPDQTLLEFFSTSPFTKLDEIPGKEIVGGILLPGRSADGVRRQPATPEEFRTALESAPVAAIATVRVDPVKGGSRLATETFVRTRGALAGALFSAYWLPIAPFSSWIRRMFLDAARVRAEARAPTIRQWVFPR